MKEQASVSKNKSLPPFDKYSYYMASVQSPEEDAKFLERVYREARGGLPDRCVMREDFCGTFSLCCEWVKRREGNVAFGIDNDPEPVEYGRTHYLSELNPTQRERVHILERDVLDPEAPSADIINALNFSYFIFKERGTLRQYFERVHNSLNDDGIFVLDCFGGSKCYEANEEETEYEDENFSYYWDQDSYDPLTNHAQFYIHFKRKGEKKRTSVFSYDWRLWSIPEIREILSEAGFSQVRIYWEGTTEDGEGDGNFNLVEEGEECESWVCYLVALK